jgi:isopenicillin N synthase-like dioxygenase
VRVASRALSIAKEMFELTESVKRASSSPDSQYRYGWRASTAAERPSEVWQVGLDPSSSSWPQSASGHRKVVELLLREAIATCQPLLDDALLQSKEASVDVAGLIDPNECMLRLLHYGPSNSPPRFSAHTDFGIATMFIAESSAGLQLQDRDGRWFALEPHPLRCLVVAGEMLAERTGGAIRAVPHRVESSQNERWSAVVFLHPSPGYVLAEGLPAKVFFDKLMARVIQQGR